MEPRHYIHVSCSDMSPHPKRHLDRSSHFCRAHRRDRPTDRPRYSICNNLRITVEDNREASSNKSKYPFSWLRMHHDVSLCAERGERGTK